MYHHVTPWTNNPRTSNVMATTSAGSPSLRTPSVKSARSRESFESLYKRSQAAEILQSYEKLSWYSFQRAEVRNGATNQFRIGLHADCLFALRQSMVQTRLYFQNIVAGFTEQDEQALVYWKEDFTPHALKPGEDAKGSRKERDAGGAEQGRSAGKGKGREKSNSNGSASGSAKKKRRSSGVERRT